MKMKVICLENVFFKITVSSHNPHSTSSLCAKQLPPVALITSASSAIFCLHSILQLCPQINLFFYATYHSLLKSWKILKKEGNCHWTAKKLKSGPTCKKTKDKKKTLINNSKGSGILIPKLLPCLFLLVFPISHKQWRPLYKCTLKFNKENLTFILHDLYYCLWITAKIILLAVNAGGAMISLAGGLFCWHTFK